MIYFNVNIFSYKSLFFFGLDFKSLLFVFISVNFSVHWLLFLSYLLIFPSFPSIFSTLLSNDEFLHFFHICSMRVFFQLVFSVLFNFVGEIILKDACQSGPFPPPPLLQHSHPSRPFRPPAQDPLTYSLYSTKHALFFLIAVDEM